MVMMVTHIKKGVRRACWTGICGREGKPPDNFRRGKFMKVEGNRGADKGGSIVVFEACISGRVGNVWFLPPS